MLQVKSIDQTSCGRNRSVMNLLILIRQHALDQIYQGGHWYNRCMLNLQNSVISLKYQKVYFKSAYLDLEHPRRLAGCRWLFLDCILVDFIYFIGHRTGRQHVPVMFDGLKRSIYIL